MHVFYEILRIGRPHFALAFVSFAAVTLLKDVPRLHQCSLATTAASWPSVSFTVGRSEKVPHLKMVLDVLRCEAMFEHNCGVIWTLIRKRGGWQPAPSPAPEWGHVFNLHRKTAKVVQAFRSWFSDYLQLLCMSLSQMLFRNVYAYYGAHVIVSQRAE